MIKKLSENIIKQIAAGEVIQKPYNAVKELLENAIDAKSTKIEIFFQNFGLQSIIIIDNGIGIEKKDLLIATQLHTTSKTQETDKTFGVNFLGFRGEALASIDVISNLTIESNNNKLNNNIISISNINKGTKITIENLFQKTPARLKFIKNPNIEFKNIKEIIKKYIINYENIEWKVFHNNKNLFEYKINNKLQRIKNVFNEEPLVFENNSNNIQIQAYIFKNKTNFSYIFINNRPIKDKSIFKYIDSLFKEYSFINENPGYILFVKIDDIWLDYNVHPAKEEIKFFNYTEIFKSLHSIFSMQNLSYKIHNTNIMFESHLNNYNQEKNTQELTTKIQELYNSKEIFKENPIIIKKSQYINEELNIEQDNKKHFKIIGQLKNSYILFETKDGLGIFDQHAAHERIIYEQMKKDMSKANKQSLLNYIQLELNVEQQEFLNANKLFLIEKGIIIKNNKITNIPTFSKEINFKIFFENLEIPCNLETELNRLLANIACKNALKANKELSIFQMQALLEPALIQPPICNHGRPVFKYFSNNEILNFFKRT